MVASGGQEIKITEPSYGSVMPTKKHVLISKVAGEPFISEYVMNHEL